MSVLSLLIWCGMGRDLWKQMRSADRPLQFLKEILAMKRHLENSNAIAPPLEWDSKDTDPRCTERHRQVVETGVRSPMAEREGSPRPLSTATFVHGTWSSGALTLQSTS